jgi:hypothetical protein
MIERTKVRFDLQPEKLAAGTAYGSGGVLARPSAGHRTTYSAARPRFPGARHVHAEDFTFDRQHPCACVA